MDSSDRVIVTGASGLLGGNMLYQWSARSEVLGLDRNPFPGYAVSHLDLLDRRALKEAVDTFRPTVIINSAAMANVDACEEDPRKARAMNADLVADLADLAARHSATLVHISTDQVFDGNAQAPYGEADEPHPINEYGRSKLQGERAALAYDPALILRTNIFGWNLARDKGSFAEWLYGVFASGEEATLFEDVFFTPIYIGDLLSAVETALERGLTGLYHLAGGESLSKERFGRLMARMMQGDDSRVRTGRLGDVSLRAPRPRYMSLSSRRFEEACDTRLPDAREGVARFLEDRERLPVARAS